MLDGNFALIVVPTANTAPSFICVTDDLMEDQKTLSELIETAIKRKTSAAPARIAIATQSGHPAILIDPAVYRLEDELLRDTPALCEYIASASDYEMSAEAENDRRGEMADATARELSIILTKKRDDAP